MDLRELSELRKKLDRAKREADKAQGALDRVMQQIREEYDCPSLEALEARLQELEKTEAETKELLHRRLKRFKTKWKRVLQDL
jgi:predicted  nucleic acid-binding Zn-ribbon protein